MIKVRRFRTFRFAFATCTLLFSALHAPSASADASTLCTYDLLLESHAMVNRCGETLDAASEQRFNVLMIAARQGIIENSASLKKSPVEMKAMLDKMDTGIKARYIGRDPAFCKTSEYRDALFMLKSLTSEKTYSGIKKTLKLRRNPQEGDCL